MAARSNVKGIVGESGSGKSATARSIVRPVPNPPGKIIGGSISFNGEDLLTKKESEMRSIRGKRITGYYYKRYNIKNFKDRV